MGNQYENAEFESAAQAAGVSGVDWSGEAAIRHCSNAFHNELQHDERDSMSFSEMVDWASDWWSMNSHKYS